MYLTQVVPSGHPDHRQALRLIMELLEIIFIEFKSMMAEKTKLLIIITPPSSGRKIMLR